jgi:thymidine kinase
MQHRLVLFTGAMFSGKSNALIIATDRARQVLPKCVAIKCKLDTRSSKAAIVARTGLTLPADVITDRLATVQPQPGLLYSVDEGQFFPDLLPFWHRVVSAGAYLAVAGLDLDFRRQPFGQVSARRTADGTAGSACCC